MGRIFCFAFFRIFLNIYFTTFTILNVSNLKPNKCNSFVLPPYFTAFSPAIFFSPVLTNNGAGADMRSSSHPHILRCWSIPQTSIFVRLASQENQTSGDSFTEEMARLLLSCSEMQMPNRRWSEPQESYSLQAGASLPRVSA